MAFRSSLLHASGEPADHLASRVTAGRGRKSSMVLGGAASTLVSNAEGVSDPPLRYPAAWDASAPPATCAERGEGGSVKMHR